MKRGGGEGEMEEGRWKEGGGEKEGGRWKEGEEKEGYGGKRGRREGRKE